MTRRELIRNAALATAGCMVARAVGEGALIPMVDASEFKSIPESESPVAYWPKLFREINNLEAYESEMERVGLYHEPTSGVNTWPFPFQVRPFKVGIGCNQPHDVALDDLSEAEASKRYAEMLAEKQPIATLAIGKTIERMAGQVFDNCRSTDPAYKNPDGLPLASAYHRLYGQAVGQGTASNLLHGPANEGSVNQAISELQSLTSHSGDSDPHVGPYEIVCHPGRLGEMYYIAKNLAKSLHKPVTVLTSPYIFNEKQVIVRDALRHPFCVLLRKEGIRGEAWSQIEKETGHKVDRFSFTKRFVFFCSGWRGAVLIEG